VLENPPVNMRYGNGWAILDTSCYSDRPGVHDIGAALDLTSATMLLAILRAAESWAPESDDVMHPDAIVRRKGRVRVQFADGSTQQLDLDAEFLPNTRPLLRVSNLGMSIAHVLLIARKAG
jgi:hypothetical protein